MDSGFLVDASSGVLGGGGWALAVGGGRVRGTREVRVVIVCGGKVGGGRKATERARRQGLSHRYYR